MLVFVHLFLMFQSFYEEEPHLISYILLFVLFKLSSCCSFIHCNLAMLLNLILSCVLMKLTLVVAMMISIIRCYQGRKCEQRKAAARPA